MYRWWINGLEWSPLSGCGTQHPHRALGGACVLLAAAPTTPPCFRHWRRSSLLHFGHIQRKIIFYFAFGATAFAERSVAMKAPVGLLSGRAVCVSRWRGFAPTSSADAPLSHFHGERILNAVFGYDPSCENAFGALRRARQTRIFKSYFR